MSIFDALCLKGKRALVTGSSRGIGTAIANALEDAGAEVIRHGVSERPGLAGYIAGDLGNPDALEKVIAAAGDIDILVLNASTQRYQTVEDFSPEDFEEHFRINVSASMRMIQAFLPGMQKKKWGRVLALGSVNQWKQSPRLPIYAATKSALSNVMQNCARKYAADGITFNVLAPGVIATDRNTEALANPEIVEKLMNVIPARRFGTAEDCAGLALLLCSTAGSYITGSDIAVAGGMQL